MPKYPFYATIKNRRGKTHVVLVDLVNGKPFCYQVEKIKRFSV